MDDIDLTEDRQKDEMRKKKSYSENNNPSLSSQQSTLSNTSDTSSVIHVPSERSGSTSDTVSVTSLAAKERHLSSEDSTDQYIVVDTLQNDDHQDSPSETDEVDGYQPSEEITVQEIERLLKKIEKTKEELVQMQLTKDEVVKEYLKSADGSDIPSEIAMKTKTNFERNNQRTNTSIQLLQKKLEKYQGQLKLLEERGIHGPKRIIRAVQDSMRSGASSITEAVSKPLGSFNNFMKKEKKSTSTDNVTQNEDGAERENSINCSDEDSSSCSNNILGSSHHSDIDCTIGGNEQMNHFPHFLEQVNTQNEEIRRLTKENNDLKESIEKVKDDVGTILQTLQEERYKNEQLSNELGDMYHQWHDLTELHQNEMSGLKQEMDQTLERIECMEYRFSERSGDIEEAVGSCETRITKMELQQQHQQQLLLSVDGYFDAGGNTKILLSKLLSLVLSIFTIALLLLSTLTRIVMPFTSTRTRIITTTVAVFCFIIFIKNTDNGLLTLYETIRQLFQPLYNIFPHRTQTNSGKKLNEKR